MHYHFRSASDVLIAKDENPLALTTLQNNLGIWRQKMPHHKQLHHSHTLLPSSSLLTILIVKRVPLEPLTQGMDKGTFVS
jgi:hypothetical protein